MAGSPMWVWVARHIGKKKTYLVAATGHGLLTLAWGFMAHAPMPVAYVLAALTASCNAGWGLIVLSLLSDAIAAARTERGENRAGSYSAIWSVIEKSGIALGGTLVVGTILSASGFNAAAAKVGTPQTAYAMAGIVVAYSTLPGLAKLMAAALIWFCVKDESAPAAKAELAHG